MTELKEDDRVKLTLRGDHSEHLGRIIDADRDDNTVVWYCETCDAYCDEEEYDYDDFEVIEEAEWMEDKVLSHMLGKYKESNPDEFLVWIRDSCVVTEDGHFEWVEQPPRQAPAEESHTEMVGREIGETYVHDEEPEDEAD